MNISTETNEVEHIMDQWEDEREDSQNSFDEADESEAEDSDYVIDEELVVDEIHVDMRDYNLHIDKDVEFMGTSRNQLVITCDNELIEEDEDMELMDNLNFSATDEDEEDENVIIRGRKIRELRKNQLQICGDDPKTQFSVGQTFGNSREVKDLVNKIAVETRRELKIVKNDKKRVRVVCVGKKTDLGVVGNENFKCPWVLQVSKLQVGETWKVKTHCDKHKCSQSRLIKQCSSVFLANEIMQQIEGNPDIPTQALKEELEKKYAVKVSNQKAYYAKQKV